MKGHAILEAAHQVGRDGKGVVEEVGLHTETYFVETTLHGTRKPMPGLRFTVEAF